MLAERVTDESVCSYDIVNASLITTSKILILIKIKEAFHPKSNNIPDILEVCEVKYTYKLQVWDIKAGTPGQADFKNPLTFDVNEAIFEEVQKTWNKNIVIDLRQNDFYIPDYKHSLGNSTSKINRINIHSVASNSKGHSGSNVESLSM